LGWYPLTMWSDAPWHWAASWAADRRASVAVAEPSVPTTILSNIRASLRRAWGIAAIAGPYRGPGGGGYPRPVTAPERSRDRSGRRPVLALVGWTFLVWTFRIGTILGDDDLDGGDKAGALALALSFTVLALLVLWAELARPARRRGAVLALVGWTVAVWVVRAADLAVSDRGASFVVVHLLLAVGSVALAGLALRAVGTRAPAPAPGSAPALDDR
jgi:hypothetical protein